jgi:sulfide:quinone oxidoreductase
MTNHDKQILELIDSELKAKGISRRDAMKIAGVGSAAFLFNPTEAEAATPLHASSAKGKVLIVGGGLAGVATAAKLSKLLDNPDITIVEPNPKSVSYQPGQTLVAAGIWEKDDIDYDTKDYVPSDVKWVQDSVTEFDPDNNSVTTAKGEKISYDVMVVATGLVLDYGRINGLFDSTEGTSIRSYEKDNKAVRDVIGKNGITSLYYADGAVDTWKEMQKFVNDAKSGKKVKGVFSHPNTPIKCGGAPKKIMYLTNSRLNEAGARANAELTFYPNGGKMFGVPEYHDAILQQYKDRDFKWHYKHNLTAVDPVKKIATFDKRWEEKGEYDEDIEEYEMITKHENVEVPFDFLHITPPMKAPDEVATSAIGSGKGWVPVNKETLQHVKYPNVFSLGDVAAVPMGKTGGSARKQYAVAASNIVSYLEGKELTAKYAGYTVCPLITDIGTVMLAEFNWTKKPTPSFPLDPTKERWIWWLLKVYALKPMTVHGMLTGRA